jgi:hypothetical protein
VDDITKSWLEDDSFDLIFDKGTLDSIAMVSNKFIERSMLDPLYKDEENINNNNSIQENIEKSEISNQESSNEFVIPNIILSEELECNQVDSYAKNINRILKSNGYLLIISCNHDTKELTEIFQEKAKLQLVNDYTELFNDLRMMIFQKK